jgi:CRP-like cAMP-binding protein
MTPELAKPADRNYLLAALPRAVRSRIAHSLQSVPLELGQVLHRPGATLRHVYFPTSAMISLLTVVHGGKALEVGLVGPQGMVGVSLVLGVTASPVRAIAQSEGSALRMSVPAFVAELKRNRWLRRETSRYAHVSMATAMHIAACNLAHTLESRLARWLLMTRDCLRTDTFLLTQEFLAQMLGVRRTGVSQVAARLQQRGVVRYSRGKIIILDVAGLRATSCACYETIRRLTERSRRAV